MRPIGAIRLANCSNAISHPHAPSIPWLLSLLFQKTFGMDGMDSFGMNPYVSDSQKLMGYTFHNLLDQVREAVTILDLDVIFYPCPQGGPTWRPKAKQLSGKNQFPFLVDPNNGRSMLESDDIIDYLWEEYGDGKVRSPLWLHVLHQNHDLRRCGYSMFKTTSKVTQEWKREFLTGVVHVFGHLHFIPMQQRRNLKLEPISWPIYFSRKTFLWHWNWALSRLSQPVWLCYRGPVEGPGTAPQSCLSTRSLSGPMRRLHFASSLGRFCANSNCPIFGSRWRGTAPIERSWLPSTMFSKCLISRWGRAWSIGLGVCVCAWVWKVVFYNVQSGGVVAEKVWSACVCVCVCVCVCADTSTSTSTLLRLQLIIHLFLVLMWLQDPNSGIAMFETKPIIDYLEKTYAV